MSIPDDPKKNDVALDVIPRLGQRVFGGAIWTFGQTVGGKLAGIAAQLVLAAILTKGDFGRVAEVMLIVSLASLGRQLGISEILVRRHRCFERWAQVAFWISLCAGLLSAALVVMVSPFADHFFKDGHGLQSLLLVVAIGLPFEAVTLISQAKLQVDLRFRALAVLGTANVVGLAVLSVCFAATSLEWPHSPVSGAMCIILPRPLMSVVMLVASFSLSGFRPRKRISPRRWWIILRDSRYFFLTGFCNTFLSQGDYLLVGLFFSTERLGAYYFAFNLSTQAVQLVSSNLASVLLPSFAKLDREPARQRMAYLKVCGMLALVGGAMCMMQGVLGGSLLHLIFGGKWDEAIPLFDFLTVAMFVAMPCGPSVSMMLAQGRYSLLMWWTGLLAVLFLGSVSIGAMSGSTMGVAIADMIFYAIFGPIWIMIALPKGSRKVLPTLQRVYAGPLAAGVLGTIVALGCLWLLPVMPEIAAALVGSGLGLLVYFVGSWLWCQQDLVELLSRLRPLVCRFSVRGA